jgi:hypothetical protein
MHVIQLLPNKHRRILTCWLLGLILIPAILGGSLHAQNTYGSTVGTITDHSGAVVGGATVVLTNIDTGDKRTVSTNANGD